MRFGIWAIAALIFGALLAHFFLQDRGYVLINFRGLIIEMSVPGLALLLAASYLIVRLVVRLWRAPRRLGEALAGYRVRTAGDKLTRGLMHMTEGDWGRGERLLTRGIRASEAPLVNYLMAARAAQQQGSRERRNEWLKLAFEELPQAETAILLTQAELQLDADEHEPALATLQRIADKQPDNPIVIGLLAEAYHALGDTHRIGELIPKLSTASLPRGTRIARIVEGLEACARAREFDTATLERLWSALSPALRKDTELLAWRARALDRLGAGAQAEGELRSALKRDWNGHLVRVYGELQSGPARKQLKQAESWLEDHADDGTLLLTAARLCLANQLWGKARSYLESSLALEPDPGAYALYGQLLAQLGEADASARAYRTGLGLVSGTELDLPSLTGPKQLAAD